MAVLLIFWLLTRGPILGPLLFTIYINDLGKSVQNANFHFYADDTVIYCCEGTLLKAVEYLQLAFKEIEAQLLNLRLVLSAEKTKMMIFTKSKEKPHCPIVCTSQYLCYHIANVGYYIPCYVEIYYWL